MVIRKALPTDTGKYVFLLGFALAVIAGIIAATKVTNGVAEGLGLYTGWVAIVLIVLGILVGFLNIQPKERHSFLIAAIALAALGLVSFEALKFGSFDFGIYVTTVVRYIVVFVAPAAAIAALYEIYGLAKA